MSKKKTISTMSLKDFHGGSIPSDLALPSAPGVLARSDSDRSVSTNWGNNLGRSDLRPRPKSSGAARNLDEKPLVLSHSAPIGQNFDEEERKPLNGVFTPHQTISEVRTSSPVHQDMKLNNVSSVRVSDRSASSPSFVNRNSPLREGGGNHFAVSSQPPGNNNGKRVGNLNIPIGNNSQGVNNSQPNAWGVRKEVMAIEEMAKPSLLSGPDALSKISQASALEKVSSGMWQSKKPSQLLPHSPYSRDNNSNVLGGVDVVSKRTDYNASQGSQVETGQVAEDRMKGRGRESSKRYIEEVQGLLLAQTPPPEISERLNSGLLQKTGPLETSENDSRQGYQQPVAAHKIESGNELYRTADNSLKAVTTVAEGGNQMVERAVERRKLNLKPRSQPLDQSDGRLEKDRETLFGGGRPRELVLKERGIDEIVISNLDTGHELTRVNTPKNEATSERSVPYTQHNQNAENLTYEKRIGKNFERKEQQMGQGKDNQGRNRRIENRWSSRDAEKQQQDRRPEPDTWRKPIQEEKPTSDYASGIRHGKIVSSLDLARAFSKSVSDPAHDQNSSQRGLPGHSNQMPFSRLTDTRQLNSAPTARHRINGY